MKLLHRSSHWIFLALPLFITLGALLNPPLAIAATADADTASTPETCESGECANDNTDISKPTALLASPSRIESLLSWLHRNSGATVDAEGATYVVPGELAQYLRFDYRTLSLDIEALPDTDYGGDIVLAERILSGKIGRVIYFYDPSSGAAASGALKAQVDLNLILRACDVASVPVALNEASADVGITALRAKTKAYLIFNPIAGQRDSDEDLAVIRETLEPFLTLTVVETERDLDPAIQTKKLVEIIQNDCKANDASSTKCIILASGGDGTVSAVAGATMGSGIPVGIIPRGTANAFSVALGIPTEVRAACRNILRGNVRVVDGATANDVPMILLAGIGFEAGMVENAPREVKDKLGCLAYVIGGVRQFFTQEMFRCKLDIDGLESVETDVAAITVANVAPPTSITAYGSGEVVPDDGLLDITIAVWAKDTTYLDGLYGFSDLLARAIVKKPTENESILGVRAKSIAISCDPPQKVVIDGEMLEMEPVVFTAAPGALHVIAPPA